MAKRSPPMPVRLGSKTVLDMAAATAASMALPSDVKLFFQAYGDSFVDTVCQGAEFIGVYVFYCQTSDEQVNTLLDCASRGFAQ